MFKPDCDWILYKVCERLVNEPKQPSVVAVRLRYSPVETKGNFCYVRFSQSRVLAKFVSILHFVTLFPTLLFTLLHLSKEHRRICPMVTDPSQIANFSRNRKNHILLLWLRTMRGFDLAAKPPAASAFKRIQKHTSKLVNLTGNALFGLKNVGIILTRTVQPNVIIRILNQEFERFS